MPQNGGESHWKPKEPEALCGEVEISQNTSRLRMKRSWGGCVWLLPHPCTHTRFCRAGLVPGELGAALWGRLVAKAVCSEPHIISASLLCSSVAPALPGAAAVAAGASPGACSCICLPLLCLLSLQWLEHFSCTLFDQALGMLMGRFVLEIQETSPEEEAASPVCLELPCHNNGFRICLI